MRRDELPEQGKWALPGGFVALDETVDQAAARVLFEKGGLKDVFLEQLYTFGDLDRDPRGRVVSVAYYALVHPERLVGRDLVEIQVPWAGETGGPAQATRNGQRVPLAFDHADMLGLVVKRLRGKLDYADLGFELLPKAFSLRQLQDVHEAVLGRRLNKDSFRRRLLAGGGLVETGRREHGVGHRPAALYRFRRR